MAHAQDPQERPIDLGAGVYQTLALISPWLRQPEREELQALARAYVD